MRKVVAGIAAGIVVFIWGALAHTVLPLGEVGMHQAGDQEPALIAALKALPEDGIYLVPGIQPSAMSDEAAMAAFRERAMANPYAFVVHQSEPRDPLAMGPMLGMQVVSDSLAGLVIALLFGALFTSAGRGLALGAGFGLFSWLTTMVPYWNWYRFPTDFTMAGLAEGVIGWGLGGLVIALILGRRRPVT